MTTNGHKKTNGSENVETLSDDCVLIAGAGPVGLLLSVVLASYGIKSVLLERNSTTTKWPKMDLTNARSMELFRKLGLAEELRVRGVRSDIPSTVLISSGLSKEEPITKWLHPSVDQYRARIAQKNDGTLPLEPYQRISQSIFEAWLKSVCDKNSLIDPRFGWKVESVDDSESGVTLAATDVETGENRVFHSKYVIGCDGASSQVRRSLKIPLDGGPTPGYVLLIHFKSRDLRRLQRQGQFWHIFFLGKNGLGGAIIAQDEIDTWTVHFMMPLDMDHTQIDSHDAIYTVLGGLNEKYPIEVDEILVRSTYRPSIAIARNYSSLTGRVYLAGDAAHQNIPTGGYGMNMGLGDAFDLGWKLATVINRNAGEGLLQSYELDRRPVATMSIERSGVHMATHMGLLSLLEPDTAIVDHDSAEGQTMRQRIHDYYQEHDGENKDLGVEMGYRYKSAICVPDESIPEPEWLPSRFIPTTWPGSRAPHVFLNDGSAIFDHYGKYFTLVEFVDAGTSYSVELLLTAAKANSVLISHVRLVGEEHARQLWEKSLVLVRPDGHVSWRGNSVADSAHTTRIVQAIAGIANNSTVEAVAQKKLVAGVKNEKSSNLVVIEMASQDSEYRLERMGEFQQ